MAASPRTIGLTGGIGSGKSAAAAMFAALGAAVIDSDIIAREITAPGGMGIEPIRARFGDAVIASDGSLNRDAMRQLVFANRAAKASLEAILHPLINIESERRSAQSLADGAPYVIMVVPLLIESPLARARVSRVAVVDCTEETQIARVMARSGLEREEVLRIMATQATREQRRAAADDVIDNEGDLADLRVQVEALHRNYLSAAGKIPQAC
jgi:dephospho-CoA kinase